MYEKLLGLAIVIAVAEVFGLLAKKIRLPQVVGQIIAGLLIGPCLLNWVQNDEYVQIFAEVGAILLMFSAGLETNLKTLVKTGPVALLIACMGVFVPLVGGTLLTIAFYGWDGVGTTKFFHAVFIGTIMTATSVGITVQTLKELGKISTELGTTVVSAAIIDDVIGIVVLTVVLGTATGEGSIGMTLLKTILFFLIFGVAGFGLYKFFKWFDKRYPHRRRVVIFGISICFALSYVAERFFGIADITGAYLAGVILCNVNDSKYIDRRVNISSYLFFGPIFFASIGLKTNITGITLPLLIFSIAFVAVALIAKIVGCGLAAKITKHSLHASLICGVGMMTRGEVALIVSQKGLDAGLITSEEFTPVILLIIVSSVLTPILLKVLFTKVKDHNEEIAESVH